MQTTDKTAKEIFHDVMDNPQRVPFGFGKKAVLVNVDPQKAYTRTDLFKTAYETDPKQLEYTNQLARGFRAKGWPVVWTHVAFLDSAEDAGVWGTRTDTPDSLQNIKYGSERAEFDVIITGGSTSGCIRATAVESLSRGYRTIVPMECVSDKHESYHYANLTDLHLKYADVMPVADVLAWLEGDA